MAIANINYHYSKKNKRYQINNYASTLKTYRKWLKNYIPAEIIIQTDEDFKAIRKKRTILNNEIKSFKECYNACFGILMGSLLNQRKELEGLLQEKVDKLTKAINDYKKSKATETDEEQIYEINYKTTNKEVYDKIIDFINQLEGEKQ